jgi:outer membrane protein assembly factor BamB
MYHLNAKSLGASPTVYKNRVYWIGDTHLCVSDIQEGVMIRKYEIDGYRCTASIYNDQLYITGKDALFELNTVTGTMLKKHVFCDKAVYGVRGMAVCENILYVPTIKHGVFALDIHTGAIVWRAKNVYSDTKVSIVDGVVYVAGGELYALDSKTGEQVWVKGQVSKEKYSPSLGLRNSAPIVVGDYLYVGGGLDSYVYCFDRHTGDIVWEYQTGDIISSTPAYANGCLVIGSHDGLVYCFEQA